MEVCVSTMMVGLSSTAGQDTCACLEVGVGLEAHAAEGEAALHPGLFRLMSRACVPCDESFSRSMLL